MKKKVFAFSVLCTCLVLFIISCKKSSEDKLAAAAGMVACDTIAVQYSTDIVSILQASCYSCHGNGSTGGSGGILLEGYTNLVKWVNNGFLAGNITHAPGYVPMPYGESALPDCEVSKIVAWIHQGAKNN